MGGERSELFLCEFGVVDDEDVGEGGGDDRYLHGGKRKKDGVLVGVRDMGKKESNPG